MTQLDHTRTPIRLVRPVLAWVAACGASGLTLFASFGLLGALEDAPTARDMAEFVGATIPATLLLSLYIALFTALPTLAAAWLMHWRGWQGLTASGLLGFLAGGALVQVLGFPLGEGVDGLKMTLWFAAVGAVGGLVYRGVAGRPRPPY